MNGGLKEPFIENDVKLETEFDLIFQFLISFSPEIPWARLPFVQIRSGRLDKFRNPLLY